MAQKQLISPWFSQPPFHESQNTHDRRVAIIGAGLSGLMTAFHLQNTGFKVTVFDVAKMLPNRQCKNPAMILQPSLSPDLNFFDQYYTTGFLGMRQFILQTIPEAIITTGITNFAVTKPQQIKALQIAKKRNIPDEYSDLALTINPTIFTQFLLQQLQETPSLGLDKNPVTLKKDFNAVIIATGQFREWGVAKPGQVSIFPENTLSKDRKALRYQGYCIPDGKDHRVLGASFRHDHSLEIREEDHLQNLAHLAKADPELAKAFETDLAKVTAFTGMRYTELDHLPVVGGLPIKDMWLKNYERLRYGDRRPNYPPCPYHEGLYLNLAHGSKGLSSSFMASQILTALLTGRALPIGVKLWEAIHPARFWLRDLKHA